MNEPSVVLVRYRIGLVGESKRVVHVVPVTDHHTTLDTLTAYCGLRFTPGTVDLVPDITGTPCFPCLLNAEIPSLTDDATIAP
jgi:hypothetical protein